MKIAGAITSMDAARTYTDVNSFTTGLQAGRQTSPLIQNQFNNFFRSLTKSSPVANTRGELRHQPAACGQITKEPPTSDGRDHALLSALTGEIVANPIRVTKIDIQEPQPLPAPPWQTSTQATITSRLVHYEKETTYFSSSGTIRTEDGRKIDFSLDLCVQRTETETMEISVNAGRMRNYLLDPLILSFTGGPPAFSSASFLFDLDGDGKEERIAGLQQGCGFLAFDRNNDGVINNGLELFGPCSGDGFADLDAFDTDGNMWIDNNDPIFENLSIWQKNENGEDILKSLQEAGVGAIHLARMGTKFLLQDPDNECLGQVTANGIFLTEGGEVRSLQEVELSIGSPDPAEESSLDAGSALLDAIASLRLLISMQRLRAQLFAARNRYRLFNSHFPMDYYQSQNPFIRQRESENNLSGTVFAASAMHHVELAGTHTLTLSQKNRPGLFSGENIIAPMFSLAELRDSMDKRYTEPEKNNHFSA